MNSATMTNTQRMLWEESRFSPSDLPKRRAHSLATNSLLREPVDMYNRRNNPRIYDSRAELPLDFAAYIEHSRAALESQRTSFERERKAFAQERNLWETERMILKSQIAHLESAVEENSGGLTNLLRGCGSGLPPSSTGKALPPGSTDYSNGVANGHRVWEGPPSASKPTRVFPDELNGGNTNNGTQGNGGVKRCSLDFALRERSYDIPQQPKAGVPNVKLDSELDGIVLKSSRLPSETVNKSANQSPESQESPLGSKLHKSNSKRKSSHQISLSNLGPPEENLTKDAGHTPMAVIDPESDVEADSSNTADNTTKEEVPLAPQTTIHRPSDKTNSYFPDVDEDPALTGPLGLQNDETADNAFLNELDERLLDEANKIISGPSGSSSKGEEAEAEEEDWEPDPVPEIKFKKTANNFGAPFGSTRAL